MSDHSKMELELFIVSQNATLRELRDLRLDLYTKLEKKLIGEDVELDQASDTRSLDPAIVGAIGIVFLPVIVEKLGDLLIDWAKQHDCSITIKVPISGTDPLEIAYNPKYVSEDELEEYIKTAVRVAQFNNG